MLKSPIEPTEAEQVDAIPYASEWQVIPTLIRQVVPSLLAAALACLVVFNVPLTFAVARLDQSDKPNFSGSWTLDRGASTSLESLMTQIGGSSLDRKYAAETTLKANLQQTEDVLTVATRGPGFTLDQTLYLADAMTQVTYNS